MIFLKALLFISVIQTICAMIAIFFRSDKLTDLAYGMTFFVIVWWLYLWYSEQFFLQTILLLIVSLRAVRIASYLFLRVLALGKDKRFDGIRENKKVFAKFRLLQALCIFLLSLPLIFAFSSKQFGLFWYSYLAGGIVLFGIYIESMADRQKFQRKRQYPEQRCNVGLRAKAKYPNYFGELCVRWGLYFFCFSSFSGWGSFFSLLSPLTITYLLLFVTGIPPLEKTHQAKRGDDLERKEYQKKTNVLFPF